jgi:hypothetical protein
VLAWVVVFWIVVVLAGCEAARLAARPSDEARLARGLGGYVAAGGGAKLPPAQTA